MMVLVDVFYWLQIYVSQPFFLKFKERTGLLFYGLDLVFLTSFTVTLLFAPLNYLVRWPVNMLFHFSSDQSTSSMGYFGCRSEPYFDLYDNLEALKSVVIFRWLTPQLYIFLPFFQRVLDLSFYSLSDGNANQVYLYYSIAF